MDTVTHVPELLSARKSHPFTFPGGFLKDFFFFLLCRGTLWNDWACCVLFSKWPVNLL